jgi:hypothetical protein
MSLIDLIWRPYATTSSASDIACCKRIICSRFRPLRTVGLPRQSASIAAHFSHIGDGQTLGELPFRKDDIILVVGTPIDPQSQCWMAKSEHGIQGCMSAFEYLVCLTCSQLFLVRRCISCICSWLELYENVSISPYQRLPPELKGFSEPSQR